MSTTTTAAKPGFDTQGEHSDEARVDAAMRSFVREFGVTAALHMESCVRCGICAEACHFHIATRDPKYTSVHKLELFRRAYFREASPFALLVRALGLMRKPSIAELQQWKELIYDSCTMCGRCTLACPMGIDIAELVKEARHGMFKAGLIPEHLALMDRTARQWGSPATPAEDLPDTHASEREPNDLAVDRRTHLRAAEVGGHRSEALLVGLDLAPHLGELCRDFFQVLLFALRDALVGLGDDALRTLDVGLELSDRCAQLGLGLLELQGLVLRRIALFGQALDVVEMACLDELLRAAALEHLPQAGDLALHTEDRLFGRADLGRLRRAAGGEGLLLHAHVLLRKRVTRAEQIGVEGDAGLVGQFGLQTALERALNQVVLADRLVRGTGGAIVEHDQHVAALDLLAFARLHRLHHAALHVVDEAATRVLAGTGSPGEAEALQRLRLGEVGDLTHQSRLELLMFNKSTNAQ